MDDLATAITKAMRQPNSHFFGEVGNELIRQAEETLGLTFPASYREFLSRCGYGFANGAEFYGLVPGSVRQLAAPDAIAVTLKRRVDSNLPHSYIVVSYTGDGGFYCIDTGNVSSSNESPIVEWWPGLSAESQPNPIVASSFGEFFTESALRAMPE